MRGVTTMKLHIFKYKVSRKNISQKSDYKLTFERFLFIMFILSFSLLIIAQAALMNPSIRTFLTSDNEFQGTPMGVEEYFYKEGTLTFMMRGNQVDGDVKILVNGDEVAAFSKYIVSIEVKDGDVIEIDGSNASAASEVEVVAKSPNIKSDCIGKRMSIPSGVRKVTDIKVQ